MQDSNETKIKVGFGDSFREVTINISGPRPYHPDDELELIGKSPNRTDAEAKVTGAARYTYDRKFPGMLYGKIVRCPHANADIKSIDLSAAKAMPGVKAAISFQDAFRQNAVRYAWTGVAAVAAETEQQAELAARAVKVEYEVLPFCVTKEDSMKDGAPTVGRQNQENVVMASPRRDRRRGETQEDFEKRVEEMGERFDELVKEADKVVSAEFNTQVQTHSPLETHGVVCNWEGGNLTCYCSTQATFNVRREMTSRRGGVGAENATVHCEYIGGGFGGKFSAGREGVAGAMLAREAKRAVHLMLDRREEHTDAGNRPDAKQELTMGVNSDGEITCYRARNWGTPGGGGGGAGAHNDAIYDLGHVDKIEYAVRTNCGGARALRAPGWPQGAFALEGMMDMGAAAVAMDPVEFRKKNDRHPIRIEEYDIAAAKFGWNEKFNRVVTGGGPVKRGVGVASTLWFARGGRGCGCTVRIHKNGTVEVRNGAQDIGTGTRSIMGMVAAEELGLTLDDVQTFIGNTNDPQGPGSGGSTTAPTITPAARVAGYEAALRLREIVAEAKGWNAADIELKSGHAVHKGDRIPFKEACGLMVEDQIEVLGQAPRNYREGVAGTNAGVQMAEVEVDTETGVVKVLKVTAVADAGKIINPKLAESQVRGGVIQGVSFALFERRVMDRQEGRMVNANLDQYKIVGAADCPDIDVTLLDVYMGWNNTHVMGLGEPPIVATAAAVANAVHNAIGVRVTSLPITPQKVLAALGVKEAKV